MVNGYCNDLKKGILGVRLNTTIGFGDDTACRIGNVMVETA